MADIICFIISIVGIIFGICMIFATVIIAKIAEENENNEREDVVDSFVNRDRNEFISYQTGYFSFFILISILLHFYSIGIL